MTAPSSPARRGRGRPPLDAELAAQGERSAVVQVRCTPAQKELWAWAAEQEGEPDLSTWIRDVLDGEADALVDGELEGMALDGELDEA